MTRDTLDSERKSTPRLRVGLGRHRGGLETSSKEDGSLRSTESSRLKPKTEELNSHDDTRRGPGEKMTTFLEGPPFNTSTPHVRVRKEKSPCYQCVTDRRFETFANKVSETGQNDNKCYSVDHSTLRE